METSSRSNLRGRTPRKATALLLFLFFFVIAASLQIAYVSAARFVVGDSQRWNNGVNYTVWAGRYHFHVGDWLVFYWPKGMYDVMEVNATAYDHCYADQPISNWSRGDRWAFQLNESKEYYFICSRGYCYNGMKLTLLAEPLPPVQANPLLAPPAPSGCRSASVRVEAVWTAAVLGGTVALTFVLSLLG